MTDFSTNNYPPIENEPKTKAAPTGAMERQYPGLEKVSVSEKVIDKLEQLLIFVYVVVAAILGFRFVLSLFGANRSSPFVNFVYSVTTPFMYPFENMFGRDPKAGTYVLEFEVLVALIVYALVFLGLSKLVRILLK